MIPLGVEVERSVKEVVLLANKYGAKLLHIELNMVGVIGAAVNQDEDFFVDDDDDDDSTDDGSNST